jgi:hypothetical protein
MSYAIIWPSIPPAPDRRLTLRCSGPRTAAVLSPSTQGLLGGAGPLSFGVSQQFSDSLGRESCVSAVAGAFADLRTLKSDTSMAPANCDFWFPAG